MYGRYKKGSYKAKKSGRKGYSKFGSKKKHGTKTVITKYRW